MISKFTQNTTLSITLLLLSYNHLSLQSKVNSDTLSEKLQKQKIEEQEKKTKQFKVLRDAAEAGDLKTLQALHKDGIPLNLTNKEDYQIIHTAAYYGHLHVVKWLCKHGVNPSAKGHAGFQPIHSAAMCEHHDVILWLHQEQGVPLDTPNNHGTQIMHLAAQQGDQKLIDLLAKHNISLTTENEPGFQAMHYAAIGGDPEMLAHLHTTHNIALDPKNSVDGTRPLHWTSSNGRIAALAYFLSKKAKVTQKDYEGKQPIHHAARYCRNDAVKILHQNGASLSAKDNTNNTPYDEAKAGNCYDLMGWISKEVQKEVQKELTNPTSTRT